MSNFKFYTKRNIYIYSMHAWNLYINMPCMHGRMNECVCLTLSVAYFPSFYEVQKFDTVFVQTTLYVIHNIYIGDCRKGIKFPGSLQ